MHDFSLHPARFSLQSKVDLLPNGRIDLILPIKSDKNSSKNDMMNDGPAQADEPGRGRANLEDLIARFVSNDNGLIGAYKELYRARSDGFQPREAEGMITGLQGTDQRIMDTILQVGVSHVDIQTRVYRVYLLTRAKSLVTLSC